MKKKVFSLSLLLVAAMLALSACSGVAPLANGSTENAPTMSMPGKGAKETSPQLPAPSGADDLLSAYQGTLENIYSSVVPSVVNIRVVQKVATNSTVTSLLPSFPFFSLPQDNNQNQPKEQYQSALGSGFVWDTAGHIVTNNHVVSGADKIEVTFSDGAIVPAKLIGADPDSDLAVLQVDVNSSQLHPVALANSDNVKVGQMAIAIGNPFGLEGTMTTGIISAVGRSLPANETAQSYTIPDIIQTDAPINPGNSGGVLVDTEGKVLGVTSAIESPVRANAGIGFAIPAEIVESVVPVLIKDGSYSHAWLGISGSNLVPELATAMDLDASQRGALVNAVMDNSPAAQAGLQGSDKEVKIEGQTATVGGDVITAIDDQPVVAMNDLIAYLAHTTVGQEVTLTILRNGKEKTVNLTLAARPSTEERVNASSTNGVSLGILGVNVDEAIASAMKLPKKQSGVLIIDVESGSLADTAGLRGGDESATINGREIKIGGDVITAINGQDVENIDALKSALSQLSPNDELSLSILRNGYQVEINLQSQ